MNIDNETYKEVLESGLLLDHYFLLCNLKHGKKLADTKRIQGFINLLTKKEYILAGQLTEKGHLMVENCEFAAQITVKEEQEPENKIDLAEWVAKFHKRCQDKLYELTRQRQIRARIGKDKKSYPFLCNSTDLFRTLSKAIIMYKLKNYDAIEKAIMDHMENCAMSNEWFPLVQYYILKNGASNMVTDIENGNTNNKDKGFTSQQKLV